MVDRILSIRRLSVAMLVVVTALGGMAFGAVYDSQGFESPTFTLGQLEDQDNWVRTEGTSTADVQSVIVESGTQAVEVRRAADSDDRWAVVVSTDENQVIDIHWDMYVTQTTDTGVEFGPYFAIEAYETNGSIGLIGSAGVDASTGDLLYQAGGTGFLTETGVVVPFDQWHGYTLRLDFTTDNYEVFLDDARRVTTGFVDSGLDTLTDADIAAIAAAADSVSRAATGLAYFDNYQIAIVPLPSAAWSGIVVLSLLAVIGIGKKRIKVA